jgi:NADPH:quinone reductase-like Zn-dependent oxidoreductase
VGADAVVDTSRRDMNEAVRALTNGKGVDIALDAVGGDMFEPTLKTLRRVDSTTSSKSENGRWLSRPAFKDQT